MYITFCPLRAAVHFKGEDQMVCMWCEWWPKLKPSLICFPAGALVALANEPMRRTRVGEVTGAGGSESSLRGKAKCALCPSRVCVSKRAQGKGLQRRLRCPKPESRSRQVDEPFQRVPRSDSRAVLCVQRHLHWNNQLRNLGCKQPRQPAIPRKDHNI